MATYSATKAKASGNAKAVHTGANVVVSTFVFTAADGSDSSMTAAAADVIRFAKLPKGAVVTDVRVVANRAVAGSITIGTNSSVARFGSLVSVSAGYSVMSIGLPYTVSLSDEASVYFEYLQATVTSVGYTLSDQLQMVCTYTMDP